jgi:hypothetical protein
LLAEGWPGTDAVDPSDDPEDPQGNQSPHYRTKPVGSYARRGENGIDSHGID